MKSSSHHLLNTSAENSDLRISHATVAGNDAHMDITLVLSMYFDGLYFGDTKTLNSVFHPQAQYVCASHNDQLILTMDEYFKVVDKRPSPASLNQARRDRIIEIRQIGPETALAQVECVIAPKHFTDLLSLIFVQGSWQIISKVFHYELGSE